MDLFSFTSSNTNLSLIHLAEKIVQRSLAVCQKMRIMRAIFLLVVASCVACQQLPLNYSGRSVAGAGAGMCPDTQDLREDIQQDICSLINSSVLSALRTGPGYGACGCGGPGWRRINCLSQYV